MPIIGVPGKVTLKGALDQAVNPLTVTVIGLYVAPVGTITLSEVEVADVTVALTAPNHTILFAAIVLKFVPVIVTVAPIGPEAGVKDVITGGEGKVSDIIFRRTEILLSYLFVTTMSGFPSQSISPIATPWAPVPAEKSTLAANEPVVIAPELVVFRNTETV